MLHIDQDFQQQQLDERLKDDLEHLVRLAIREDLDRGFDLTTVSVVPENLQAHAKIVAREQGVCAGADLIPWIIETIGADVKAEIHTGDASLFEAGAVLATLSGQARDVLTCERTILNFLGRLCGIASWTNRYVQVVVGLPARIYDTRKTTPGWRRLEKYATKCGGARNHRSGLYDAILIKDNHLACHEKISGRLLNPGEAIDHARAFIAQQPHVSPTTIVEIEVDTLEQLKTALGSTPDIVLLDNMSNDQLLAAVALRNELNPKVQLEASGGVRLDTLRAIAETGVDRISVGALTHSAVSLDLGLDWVLGAQT
ncbi:MAG: carboxylating nicotinate-nucleotide diphosphorylase [Planctomycetales bacterium]|nr:carboxylating nicotinate-nucleotide diphosphorylase [Planctomycetales bacterium]